MDMSLREVRASDLPFLQEHLADPRLPQLTAVTR